MADLAAAAAPAAAAAAAVAEAAAATAAVPPLARGIGWLWRCGRTEPVAMAYGAAAADDDGLYRD